MRWKTGQIATRCCGDGVEGTYRLAVTWYALFTLSTVDKSRSFSVEAMQTIGIFVNKSVILRDELPADFRRIDWSGCVGHNEAVHGGNLAICWQQKIKSKMHRWCGRKCEDAGRPGGRCEGMATEAEARCQKRW